MRLDKPRIKPLDVSEMDEEQLELVSRATIHEEPINIHLTMARHPKLFKRWLVFASYVLNKSTFPPREREIAILRIGHNCKSGYEWSQHVEIGKTEGLTDSEIEMIKQGPDAKGWSSIDSTILRATDELHSDAFISDATWNDLKQAYNDNQIMDLIFAVGNYTIVSMALNSFGVQLESK
jgi:4-carboxymuconolactone decarboxylase